MKEIQEIMEAARASISDYCMKECKAFCCRKGHLVIPYYQAEAIVIHAKNKQVTANKGNLIIPLKGDCPGLSGSKCLVYDKRPEVCRNFPLFLNGNVLSVSSYCTAVMNGKLYPYIAQLLKKGLVLGKDNPYSEYEFNFKYEKEDPIEPLIKDPPDKAKT